MQSEGESVNIETKFNIGDEVYWLSNLEINHGVIISWGCNVSKGIISEYTKRIFYEIQSGNKGFISGGIQEEELFATKAEVLEKVQSFIDSNIPS